MGRPTARRQNEQEEELLNDVEEMEEDESPVASSPAVSDRRRRRQAKSGEPVIAADAAVTRKDRPTPSQREEPEKKRNFVVRFFSNIRTYFQEVFAELGKVAWPTREEVMRLTGIVLVVTTVSAIFLGIVSLIFGGLATSMTLADSAAWATAAGIALTLIVAGLWLFRERIFGGVNRDRRNNRL